MSQIDPDTLEPIPPQATICVEIEGRKYPIATMKRQRHDFTRGAEHACRMIARYYKQNENAPIFSGEGDLLDILESQENREEKDGVGHPLTEWGLEFPSYDPPMDLDEIGE